MSPHHIDLPLASPAQELPFDRERAEREKVNWGLLIVQVIEVNSDKYISYWDKYIWQFSCFM